MARKKLHKYGQVSSSERVQEVAFRQTAKYKGQWSENFFGNQNPLVIELACGYGEYAVGLANEYPNKNYLGIDIKGDRLWKGLQDAQEIGLENVGFVRSDIFWLENIFAVGEIDEIWIIHPDPRPKREKQRLTHPRFLEMYCGLLKPNGKMYLRTDNTELFHYSLEKLSESDTWYIDSFSFDWYNSPRFNPEENFVTRYEQTFSEETIKFTEMSKKNV